ncbi:hypothetical protein THIOM_005702, partial [Candidatus Thiomargarita nelsonii]
MILNMAQEFVKTSEVFKTSEVWAKIYLDKYTLHIFIREKFILNQLIAITLETLLNQALRWNPSSLQTLQKL